MALAIQEFVDHCAVQLLAGDKPSLQLRIGLYGSQCLGHFGIGGVGAHSAAVFKDESGFTWFHGQRLAQCAGARGTMLLSVAGAA